MLKKNRFPPFQFPISHFQFPISHFQFPIAHCPLPIAHCPLPGLVTSSSSLQKNENRYLAPPFCTTVYNAPSNILKQGFSRYKTLTCLCIQLAVFFSGRSREQPKWHHVINVLQTAEPQKCYHVTRIFEPQTKVNGP